MADRMGYK
jgi:hypothetical protein